MKRLFDVVVSSILLLIATPVMLVVALLIRLDSPGPILYAAPRIGKHGKRFGLLRFRTIQLSTPDHLSMHERLTPVGRFIRNYSLDDLPSLLNVLNGELSLIGPRATEPERVELSDASWQQILEVKPGLFSPAIGLLAQQYNSSPAALKQRLEQDYVRSQSFWADLRLFWQGIQGYLVSRGNWKTRGQAALKIEYAQYQQQNRAFEPTAPSPIASAWVIGSWQQPDLSAVAAFIRAQGQAWEPYVPQCGLVPCGPTERKPALFLKVAPEDEWWAQAVELKALRWPVVASNRYLCLGCVLFFEDTTGATNSLSKPSAGQERSAQGHQRIACSTVLDVAAPEVDAWFSAWQHLSGALPLFFVSQDLDKVYERCLVISNDPAQGATGKPRAMQQWQEAKSRLQQSGHALDNFSAEYALLRQTLPHRRSWETVESALKAV